jgi:hypothetical protein
LLRVLTKNTQVPRSAAPRRRVTAVLASLACVLIALALPAFASAELFSVDTNNDDAKTAAGPVCETEFGQCSLRAAVEAADADSSFDVIDLPSSYFEGPLGANSEIQLGSTLEITQPVTIVGHPVLGGPYTIPNVAVTGPSGGATFTVKSSGVTIEDIAIGGGKYGIEVPGAFTGLKATGNWFGLFLNGSTSSIGGAGVLLGPGADGAEIGDGTADGRNVFTNAPYGIYVQGASGTEIRGNYIGVGPTGLATAAVPDGVRIVDTSTSPAEENTIGGSRTSTVGTAECGGDCNVIVASSLGVDLAGETSKNLGSATGPTTISGNYIGLAANGSGFPRQGVFGIRAIRPTGALPSVPGPGGLTVGGSTEAEANVIDNGLYAMIAEGAEELFVEGNRIGWLPASEDRGSEPEGSGLTLIDEGVTELPEVFGNEIHLSPGAVGIESYGPGAAIVENLIIGGENGVLTDEDDAGTGNLIANNLIEESDFYGVLLENDANTVFGNYIFGAGRNGVVTDRETPNPFPVENRIGGDSPVLENVIGESGESAISLGGEAQTTNEVLGNFGYENGGPFIELRENGGHPTNEEIKPPVLGVVQESSASGTAVPGAKIRLFGKPSNDPGSLEPMIGSAFADASGHWTATFATKQALGGLVAATQTKAAGTPKGATSEVSAPKAAAADPVAPVTPATGTGANPVPAPAAPVKPKAPSVKITKGPKKSSESTTAKFVFKATPAAGAKFECKLDGAKWAKCNSPKTYKKLKVGKHTFRVRAITGGLTSAAVKYQFTVKS